MYHISKFWFLYEALATVLLAGLPATLDVAVLGGGYAGGFGPACGGTLDVAPTALMFEGDNGTTFAIADGTCAELELADEVPNGHQKIHNHHPENIGISSKGAISLIGAVLVFSNLLHRRHLHKRTPNGVDVCVLFLIPTSFLWMAFALPLQGSLAV